MKGLGGIIRSAAVNQLQSKRCQNADENISIIKSNVGLIIWQKNLRTVYILKSVYKTIPQVLLVELSKTQMIVKQKFVKQTSSL